MITAKMAQQEAMRNKDKPWWVDEAFASVFAPTIGFIHFHAGFDFWSKKAKISSFFLLILIPTFICIFHAIKVSLDAKKTEEEEKKTK